MSLRNFLEKKKIKEEILEIKKEVSTRFEISFILDKFDNGGPVILFEKPEKYKVKVVANVCGTRRRICEASGVHQNKLYSTLMKAWRSPSQPKITEEGSVMDVVEKPDLSKLPILTHFKDDAGPYITSAVIHAKSLDGKTENVSVHRLQVIDKKHLAIRLVPRHLYKLWMQAKEAKKDLDVAISIGVHPAVMLAASSPVPFGISEFHVADTLMNGNLCLVGCENVNANAPAEAELVLEGRISTSKEVVEGPFVDITGTYDTERRQPLVEIIGIMHREDYLYQAILPSSAEHRLLMGLPREALIWNSVSKVVPEVHAVNLSLGGSGWLHAIISVGKQLEGDGKNALLAAFAAHPSLKHAVIVDSDINPYDIHDVEWAIATRFQASEDMTIIRNIRGSTLDSSADQNTGSTTKVGIDATRPLDKPKEKFMRAKIPTGKHIEELVDKLSLR
jgi:UbiD family decarboxylase